MFNGTIRQLPPVNGKKIIVLPIFQDKIVLCHSVIFRQSFAENRRNRNYSLLVILPLNDNEILMNVRLLDTAELPATYPGFKQDGQNRLVPHMEEIIAPA